MSQIIASLAARVASTADFVARTAAPVDAHGATPSAFTSLSSSRALFTEDGPGGAIYRLPPLLKRSAQDVQNAATMGPAFRLEDLVRVHSLLAFFFMNSLLASYLRIATAVSCSTREPWKSGGRSFAMGEKRRHSICVPPDWRWHAIASPIHDGCSRARAINHRRLHGRRKL